MKNYLAKNNNEEADDGTVIEFEGDYLAQNLDKIYFVNFNFGMFTERD